MLLVLDETLEKLNHSCALGQQDGQPLTDHVDGGEELQLAPELVVVALFRFFERGYIRVQVGFLFKRRAVDALEHLVLLAAAPVSARNVEELDVLDNPRGRHVRPRAEIDKVAFAVEADHGVLRQIADELYFVRFALFLHELDRFRARQFEALDLEVFLLDARHLGFDFNEVFRRERARRVKVVIEPVFDRGANGELDFRIQPLNRLRQHVGSGMAVCPAAVFVRKGVKLDRVVACDRAERVGMRAVNVAAQRGLGKARTDLCGDLDPRAAVLEFAFVPVRECNKHTSSPPVLVHSLFRRFRRKKQNAPKQIILPRDDSSLLPWFHPRSRMLVLPCARFFPLYRADTRWFGRRAVFASPFPPRLQQSARLSGGNGGMTVLFSGSFRKYLIV
ncbi:hypothetical protein SDC9_64286 [bioreactor metagenome]|uniref:Uncharacterized protein n=1 Tax=bioreactor metagenome TaxID=1076179 RepID=A0A644XNW3_9ZZZZ